LNEAVAQAANELLVKVAGTEDQRPVTGEPVQCVEQSHLLSDAVYWPGQQVEHGAVQ